MCKSPRRTRVCDRDAMKTKLIDAAVIDTLTSENQTMRAKVSEIDFLKRSIDELREQVCMCFCASARLVADARCRTLSLRTRCCWLKRTS